MSEVMMKVLQIQNESLTRQVETLGPENERVRNLLTEFDRRHDADQAEIERLRDAISVMNPGFDVDEAIALFGTARKSG